MERRSIFFRLNIDTKKKSTLRCETIDVKIENVKSFKLSIDMHIAYKKTETNKKFICKIIKKNKPPTKLNFCLSTNFVSRFYRNVNFFKLHNFIL